MRETRKRQGKTLGQVSRETKIKEKFLLFLEADNYSALPGFPTALGFARNFAQAIGANPNLVAALIRREFPQPQLSPKTTDMPLVPASLWTPRTTVVAIGFLTVLFLGGYLVRQYVRFASPPPLEVANIKAEEGSLEVEGKTMPSATVEVNGTPTLVSPDGSFSYKGSRPENGRVEIEAQSRTGKKTLVEKVID